MASSATRSVLSALRRARVAPLPVRSVRHGSSPSTAAAHEAGHAQSAGAAAYEAQVPHLFGEAVRNRRAQAQGAGGGWA